MASHLIESVSDLREAVKEITSHSRLSHDTETKGPANALDISGLYPFHGARSFSHIIATKEDEFYFNFNTGGINPKYKKELQPIFDDKDRIIFYVNGIFDACISHFDGIEIKSRIVDCPSIARIEYNKHGKIPGQEESFLSMEYLAEYYGVQLKIDLVKQYIKEHDLYAKDANGDYIRCRFTGKIIPLYNLVPLDLMFKYGCGDGRTSYDLGNKIIQCINFKDKKYAIGYEGPTMLSVAQNEIKFTSVLVDAKIKGMRVWPEYVEKALKKEKETSEVLHKQIDEETGGLNLNSPKQVGDFFTSIGIDLPRKKQTATDIKRFNSWAQKAKEAKEKGKDKLYEQCLEKAEGYSQGRLKTDKKTLAKVFKQNEDLEIIQKITQAKEADKKISTYYGKFMLLRDENDFIHCGLNQETAKTGRTSSSDPNLQNLHKEKWEGGADEFLIRKSFIADENSFLSFFDYSQQEMIVMLDQADEMSIIEKLRSGEYQDFYLATASVLRDILGVEITRQDAKAMALGLAYGQGKDLLAKSLGKTPDEAAEFKYQFFKALPKLKRFQKMLENQCKWNGKIHNAFGRVLYFNSDEAYKALNGYVQGTSADITKTAMNLVFEEFRKYKLKSSMRLAVHDEIIVNTIYGEEEAVFDLTKKAMVKAYPHKHIQLKVDAERALINSCGVSPWGEKTDWEL